MWKVQEYLSRWWSLILTLPSPSMLRDITAQTIQPNPAHISCIHKKHSKTQKHVKFDTDDILLLPGKCWLKAMAREKQQKARINSQPRMPNKPRIPERPVIGSSSIWRKEQLDRFLVEQSVLEVKMMIPEKWFEFGQLENYQSGNKPFLSEVANSSTRSNHFTSAKWDKKQPRRPAEGT